VPTNRKGNLGTLRLSTNQRRPKVSVVDSGYQWNSSAALNPQGLVNPLLGRVTPQRAEMIDSQLGWVPTNPEQWDANGDGRLDALAGHANFIAGVILQHCPSAAITIHNHNGGFAPRAQDFPTEAAVARSLVRRRGADVINLGFAFAAQDNVPSAIWDVAFCVLRNGGAIGSGPMVLAPAGNQGLRDPRFPGALNYLYPNHFPNMIAVGSYDPPGPPPGWTRFSNWGPWLTCSADGNNVTSTFLAINAPVEDDPTPQPLLPPTLPFTGWAIWNGTSFAAPRVVAEVAAEIRATGATPMAAWEAVRALRQPPIPDIDFGVIF
jgi:hypothetical protein